MGVADAAPIDTPGPMQPARRRHDGVRQIGGGEQGQPGAAPGLGGDADEHVADAGDVREQGGEQQRRPRREQARRGQEAAAQTLAGPRRQAAGQGEDAARTRDPGQRGQAREHAAGDAGEPRRGVDDVLRGEQGGGEHPDHGVRRGGGGHDGHEDAVQGPGVARPCAQPPDRAAGDAGDEERRAGSRASGAGRRAGRR